MAYADIIPQQPEAAIASYDYTDLASGTGYIDYYLTATTTGADSTDYILTEQTNPGGYENLNGIGFNNSYVAFDLSPFNTPRYIKGTVYLSGQLNHISTGNSVYLKVVHYDGSTETVIGAEAYQTLDTTYDYTFNVSTEVSGKLFKKGEILRVYVKTTASQAQSCISIDPSGTQPSGIIPARVSIPFKINL